MLVYFLRFLVAKSVSYTIDGKVYNFDQNGYCLNP